MPRPPVDPARLQGAALQRWYLRTPDELEAQRRATEEQRYDGFFGRSPGSETAAPPPEPAASGPRRDVLWVANGSGGYREVRTGQSDFQSTLEPQATGSSPDYLPNHAASPEPGEFLDIGNPQNPRMKREWEQAEGRKWPWTADGRPHDVAHIRAIADGGTNTLANIRPMDPAEHRESHKKDASRWAKRLATARAFGGRVEPPAHAPRPTRGPTVRGLGILGLIPNITGVLSGRIRTDTPVHFWNDMLGFRSEDDLPRGELIA